MSHNKERAKHVMIISKIMKPLGTVLSKNV